MRRCLVASRVPVLRILLTNTKVPRSTKVLVAGVKEKILKVQHLGGCRGGEVCWGGERTCTSSDLLWDCRFHGDLLGDPSCGRCIPTRCCTTPSCPGNRDSVCFLPLSSTDKAFHKKYQFATIKIIVPSSGLFHLFHQFLQVGATCRCGAL